MLAPFVYSGVFCCCNMESNSDLPPITDFEVEHFGAFGVNMITDYARYREIEAEALDQFEQSPHWANDTEEEHAFNRDRIVFDLGVSAIRNNLTTASELAHRLNLDPDEVAAAVARAKPLDS